MGGLFELVGSIRAAENKKRGALGLQLHLVSYIPALAPAGAAKGHSSQQPGPLHQPIKPISPSGVGTPGILSPRMIPMHASGWCQGCRHTSHEKIREGVSVIGKLVWASDQPLSPGLVIYSRFN